MFNITEFILYTFFPTVDNENKCRIQNWHWLVIPAIGFKFEGFGSLAATWTSARNKLRWVSTESIHHLPEHLQFAHL